MYPFRGIEKEQLIPWGPAQNHIKTGLVSHLLPAYIDVAGSGFFCTSVKHPRTHNTCFHNIFPWPESSGHPQKTAFNSLFRYSNARAKTAGGKEKQNRHRSEYKGGDRPLNIEHADGHSEGKNRSQTADSGFEKIYIKTILHGKASLASDIVIQIFADGDGSTAQSASIFGRFYKQEAGNGILSKAGIKIFIDSL